ncbi:ArsR/SmtB family transcription factor [Rothia mucilaginosa]|uniref:ArsR/SmtB family transcription factor n=1 Tax=Rothia mucilaginosa TaxID=43675 RepID=UPI00066EAF3A|nr:metalloregulator ArsR/SmtB family transcription factor [Rothia mucilaginosa]
MHSDVFSVIADPTRRRIVRILAEQTHTVGAVVEKLGMSQPTISKHLKVLRDADVVSVTVEGQRRLYSLNPDVFATVTEWINETVQIARQSNEAHVPVALPGGATAPAENKSADKASEKVVTEKVATAKPSADVSSTEASGSLSVEAPSAEEIEQARIQRARAQYLTPSARIYSRPAEQASESAASEASAEKTTAEPTVQEEAVDSTPMRPFTPASYGYDAGVTPAASATPAQPTTPAAPAEAKPVVAQKPVVFPQPAAAVSYGVDPAAVVGGSIQPIAVTPEAPAAEEPAVAEKTVNEQLAEKAEEKPPVEETVVAEKPAVEESATEKAAVEESDKAEGASEASSEEPEYQTMPAYDSVYRPSAETTSAEAKDNHRGGLFGFLRGRRR